MIGLVSASQTKPDVVAASGLFFTIEGRFEDYSEIARLTSGLVQ